MDVDIEHAKVIASAFVLKCVSLVYICIHVWFAGALGGRSPDLLFGLLRDEKVVLFGINLYKVAFRLNIV